MTDTIRHATCHFCGVKPRVGDVPPLRLHLDVYNLGDVALCTRCDAQRARVFRAMRGKLSDGGADMSRALRGEIRDAWRATHPEAKLEGDD